MLIFQNDTYKGTDGVKYDDSKKKQFLHIIIFICKRKCLNIFFLCNIKHRYTTPYLTTNRARRKNV